MVQLKKRRRLWISALQWPRNVIPPIFSALTEKSHTGFSLRCTTTTRTTVTTTEDCGHTFDCDAAGRGYHPDPFNCRKYWHCFGWVDLINLVNLIIMFLISWKPRQGKGDHFLCPDDENGIPEVFDLVYMGCNFQVWSNIQRMSNKDMEPFL